MSKMKIGFSAIFTLILLSMFVSFASAEEPFVPTPTNPAPDIYVGNVDNFGNEGSHRTHGNFQNNTNSCANCHSTHNGADARLLKFTSGEFEMCLSCHDGTLGFYNVLGQGAGAGTFNDTHESSSMHNVDGTLAIGAAPGTINPGNEEVLECSSCHNPHGSENDRLLKETVNSKSYIPEGGSAIKLSLTEDPAYAAINASTGPNGVKITKSVGPAGDTDKTTYSAFCATCHDDYSASRSAGRTHSDLYTHTSNSAKQGRNCASCHYAHGTDVTLLKDTAGKTIADLMKPTNQGGKGWTEKVAKDYMKDISAGGSANKKYTNMAVCWSCHQSTHSIDTPAVSGGDYSGKSGIR